MLSLIVFIKQINRKYVVGGQQGVGLTFSKGVGLTISLIGSGISKEKYKY